MGTTIWTTAAQIPAGTRFRLVCIPSGSSGASGGVRFSGAVGYGGKGAGGGARAERWVSRAELIADLPISIVVPAGTTGPTGPSATASHNGFVGVPGSIARFGTLLCAYPGERGTAADIATGCGGGGLMGPGGINWGGFAAAGVGGAPRLTGAGGADQISSPGSEGVSSLDGGASSGSGIVPGTPGPGGNALRGGGAGGCGGGHHSDGTGQPGSNGGASGPRFDGVTFGSGGAAGVGGLGAAGSNGADATVIGNVGAGGGGGSGNGTTGGAGGKGGNGGVPGGAGAGGGCAEASAVVAAQGGTAGNGARGECVCEAYA